MFSEDVNNPDHPEVVKLRLILEDLAERYGCNLRYFDIQNGTVTFSVDNDELLAEILRILEEK